ncbi:MAG: hypothetical protein FWC16_07360 [Defluviitaleaceae bacterium]|nr:hypothetical protein [Defluviitaleaceae bacterium]MCL2274731.1 hypothetical protein [Defluviitaleaceae bacterium]
MEAYKKELKWKIVLTAISLFFIAVSMGVLIFLMLYEGETPNWIKAYLGFFLGISIVMVESLVKNVRAIKNETRLKAKYIEETDERLTLIEHKTGTAIFPIYYLCLVVAMAVAVHINVTVVITLAFALLLQVAIKLIIQAYYKRKL